jgi:methionyl-tRNA formyltransferase
MRIIYMGTPEFAVKPLEVLQRSRHDVLAVVTAPDKPRGRGRKVSPSPIKEAALNMKLPVLQPENLKDKSFILELKSYNPDLIAVVAFRILPEAVFTLPRFGSINLHASLLPKYRGAAPINWALINGETKTGLTTFYIQKKVDTGDLLLQEETEITPEDDFGTLHDKLMDAGARLLLETIDGIENGSLKPRRQSDIEASAAPKITPLTGLIDWHNPAEHINNLIRGLSPFPGAYSFYESLKIIILKAAVLNESSNMVSGTVAESNPRDGFSIVCGKDVLLVKIVKPQGKKEMSSAEFVRGYHVKVGDRFASE